MPTVFAVHRSSVRRDIFFGLAVFVLSVIMRWPRMSDSLWMDEMTTLADYVLQPWSKVLAARAGQYVPNDHVLHTVLAKLVYNALAGGRAAADAGQPPVEVVLRLPALIAGALLPIALAWPLRRRFPIAAALVALSVAVHPWLVDLGAEARGYTLMLLFGVLATNLLPQPTSKRGRLIAYAMTLAASIYTIPLAVLLVPAHAIAVWVIRPDAWRRWIIGTVIAGAISMGLYAPMAGGLIAYYRHPYGAADYRVFLDKLPRSVLTGQRLPRQQVDFTLPLGSDIAPDPPGSMVYWVLPVLMVLFGTVIAWPRFPEARPLLATMAIATWIGVLLPLIVHGAAEVRFVLWAVPWFCLTGALLLAALFDLKISSRAGLIAVRCFAAATTATFFGLMVWWAIDQLPNQRVREVMILANRLAPPGSPVVVAYTGDLETIALYNTVVPGDRVVLPAFDGDKMARIEAESRPTGRLPWVVVLFEGLMRDQARTDPAVARLWQDLSTRYRVVARLDGRVTPMAIYAPRQSH